MINLDGITALMDNIRKKPTLAEYIDLSEEMANGIGSIVVDLSSESPKYTEHDLRKQVLCAFAIDQLVKDMKEKAKVAEDNKEAPQ